MTDQEKFQEALIPSNFYYSSDKFIEEEQMLFRKCWVYVCQKSILINNNDFFTIDISGISVVIQNFKGQIKAFQNICTHRHNKIQIEESGNRPLTCMYHGWTYDQNGLPYGIPRRKEFSDLSEAVLENLCLAEYEVSICGEFVFVRIENSNNETLESFLGEQCINNLLTISNALGNKIHSNDIINKSNWKLVVENTLEGYHLNTVHKNTFVKLGINNSAGSHFQIDGKHSSLLTFAGEQLTEEIASSKLYKQFAQRSFKPVGFFHQLVFPNLSIGSAFGLTYYIGNIKPVGPDITIFNYELFEAKLPVDVKLNFAIKTVIHSSSIEFTEATLTEDKDVVENVHKVIRQKAGYKGILSNLEKRIWAFQKNYAKYINID